MLTVIVLLIVAGILYKEFSKVRDEKSRDAVRADLSIIELNACKLREDLYNKGNADYDTVNRLYQIETLAKGLQTGLIGTEIAAKNK